MQARIATGLQGSSTGPLRDSIMTFSSSSGMVRDVRVVDQMGVFYHREHQGHKDFGSLYFPFVYLVNFVV